MSPAKRLTFVFLILLSVLLVMEGMAAALWYWVYLGNTAVANYQQALLSQSSLVFDPRFDLIGPKPGSILRSFGSEFSDRFVVSERKSFEMGFLDGGPIPNSRAVALVAGDSFARGVGAIHLPERNWTEWIKRKIPGIDVVNGIHESSQRKQSGIYERIGEHLPHDLLIISFCSANDYRDNVALGGRDRGSLLRQASERIGDLNSFLDETNRAGMRDRGCEMLAASSWLPKTLLVLARIVSALSPEIGDRLGLGQIVCPRQHRAMTHAVAGQSDGVLRVYEDEIRRLDSGVLVDDVDMWKTTGYIADRGMLHFFPTYFSNDALRRRSVSLTADSVNALGRLALSQGRKVVFVYHPSREQVYLSKEVRETLPSLADRLRDELRQAKSNFYSLIGSTKDEIRPWRPEDQVYVDTYDVMRDQLFEALDTRIRIVDLTTKMRSRAASSPRRLYWDVDDHYTPLGYLTAAEGICPAVAQELGIAPNEQVCFFSESDAREAMMPVNQ